MNADISKSAVIVVDMQNDFLKPGGFFSKRPEFKEFLKTMQPLIEQAIPNIKRLTQAARNVRRPVVYVQQVLREDYADACFPYWRVPGCIEEKFLVDGTWGAQIIDELKPEPGEMVITKKGYGAFSNTPLNIYLRNLGVSTCIMTGVGTNVCVETTIRQGTDLNYYMIVVSDATADGKASHDSSLKTIAAFFGDVMATDEVIVALQSLGTEDTGSQ